MTETPSQFSWKLIAQLEHCVKEFCDQLSSVSLESRTNYVNHLETSDNIFSHDIDVFCNNHIIRFSYYPHVSMTMAHSVLTCSISFEKANPLRHFYPLSQICGYLEYVPENALTIPMITTTESMQECFDFIASAVHNMQIAIEDLSFDEVRKTDLFNSEIEAAICLFKKNFPAEEDIHRFFADMKEDWYLSWAANQGRNVDMSDEADIREDYERILIRMIDDIQTFVELDKRKLLQLYNQQLMIRALHPAYEAYMVGHYSLAKVKMKKAKYQSAYDRSIIEYIEMAESPRPHVPSSVYKNLTELYKNGIPKNNIKEALAIAPAMLLFGLIWLPPFLGLYFLFFFFENSDAIYLLGTLDNAPSAIFPALVMGLITIFFKSRYFYKLFFRKDYPKLMELESAVSSQSMHRSMKKLAVFLLIGSMIFLYLTAHQNIKLMQNGFYDNSNFWSIQGEYYQYSDIERLDYREETPSGYGDMFPIPSYIILLKSGEVIDPYPLNTCDNRFLETLRNKNIFIENP